MAFIFGYGSLMNPRSIRDIPFEVIGPATVNGWQRSWSVRVERGGAGVTAIGVERKLSAKCNGLLVEISDEQLPALDQREFAYDRRGVPLHELQIENDRSVPQRRRCWIYEASGPSIPARDFPIVMSYSDVIISGTLDISESFTETFFKTTSNWNYIHNDREHPIYPRSLKGLDTKSIDEHMKTFLSRDVIFL